MNFQGHYGSDDMEFFFDLIIQDVTMDKSRSGNISFFSDTNHGWRNIDAGNMKPLLLEPGAPMPRSGANLKECSAGKGRRQYLFHESFFHEVKSCSHGIAVPCVITRCNVVEIINRSVSWKNASIIYNYRRMEAVFSRKPVS